MTWMSALQSSATLKHSVSFVGVCVGLKGPSNELWSAATSNDGRNILLVRFQSPLFRCAGFPASYLVFDLFLVDLYQSLVFAFWPSLWNLSASGLALFLDFLFIFLLNPYLWNLPELELRFWDFTLSQPWSSHLGLFWIWHYMYFSKVEKRSQLKKIPGFDQ